MGIAEYTSKGLEKLANLATSVSEALPNIDPTPSTLAIDPGERAQNTDRKLVDLTIPKSLTGWLSPPLTSLGFSIESKEVPGNSYTPTRSYSVIKNAVGQRSVFHIPMAILQDGSNWEVVGSVISVLRLRNQILIVMSEGLPEADLAYSLVGAPLWSDDFKITWTFVSWTHLEGIKTKPGDDQRVFIPKLLKLEDLLEEARKLPVFKITDAEIATLSNIFGRLPQFTEGRERAWRLLFDQAGLKDLAGYFEFDGAPKEVAFMLMGRLKQYAPVPASPQDQVLGLLLCQVLTYGELTPDDANLIKGVLKNYNLAPSRGDL